jgi:transcription elongation factor GreA-like protein
MTSGLLAPGSFVRHPHRPDWGLGRVQSVVGNRVTVNFEGAGKIVVITDRVSLELDDGPDFPKD